MQNDPAAKLPEKFRDPKTGAVRLDALINSYLELEKKLSSSIPAPDTPEGKARLRAATGVPETPDGYQIDVSHGLFTVDPEVNACMHEQGFTPDQAQTVYDLAAKKLVPAVREVAHQFQADREVEAPRRRFRRAGKMGRDLAPAAGMGAEEPAAAGAGQPVAIRSRA